MDTDGKQTIPVELLASLRPYSNDYLWEELKLLGGRLSARSQKFQLLPDDQPIYGKDRDEFIDSAVRFAAIAEILHERGLIR